VKEKLKMAKKTEIIWCDSAINPVNAISHRPYRRITGRPLTIGHGLTVQPTTATGRFWRRPSRLRYAVGTHDAREHAAVRHGIKVGSMVEFQFEGRRLVGRVNRLNKRATVLVEDADGLPYSDGKRYQKFYVPVGWVRNVGAGGAAGS
jgi:hypothetical protein